MGRVAFVRDGQRLHDDSRALGVAKRPATAIEANDLGLGRASRFLALRDNVAIATVQRGRGSAVWLIMATFRER